MKNGHDKIDDVFRGRLNNLESGLPEGFFEDTWAKSEAGRTVVPPVKGISPLYYIIPAILIIAGSVFLFSSSESNTNGKSISKNSSDLISNNNTALLSENTVNTEEANSVNNPNVPTVTNIEKAEKVPNSVNNISTPQINNVSEEIRNIETTTVKENTQKAYTPSIPTSVNITNNNGSSTNIITAHNKTEFTGIAPETKTEISSDALFSINKIMTRTMSSVPQFGQDASINNYLNREFPEYKAKRWSAELSASAHYLNSSIKSLSPETSFLAESRSDALVPGISYYNMSLLLNYHNKTFIASSGISCSMFSEHTDYGMVLYNPQITYEQYYNGTPYTFTENGNYYQVDSSLYWHYTYIADSVIHIADSVQRIDLDTIPVSVFDSLAISKFDTADYSKLKARYSLIEIPIYAGIEINRGKWGYSYSAGIIPGMLTLRNGTMFDGSNEIQLPSDIFPLRKFVLSGGVKMQFNYYPDTKLMFFAGPEFKTVLINASEKGSGYQQKWYSVGLRGGVRYFF